MLTELKYAYMPQGPHNSYIIGKIKCHKTQTYQNHPQRYEKLICIFVLE